MTDDMVSGFVLGIACAQGFDILVGLYRIARKQ